MAEDYCRCSVSMQVFKEDKLFDFLCKSGSDRQYLFQQIMKRAEGKKAGFER
jgi:hypothetical protein